MEKKLVSVGLRIEESLLLKAKALAELQELLNQLL